MTVERLARRDLANESDLDEFIVASGAAVTTGSAADAAVRRYLSHDDYANVNAVIKGTLISFVTGAINAVTSFYINEGLKGKPVSSAQCGSECPVDVVESAVKKLQASCEAIQKHNTNLDADTAFKVNKGPRVLDGSIVFGQEVCGKVVVSANRAQHCWGDI